MKNLMKVQFPSEQSLISIYTERILKKNTEKVTFYSLMLLSIVQVWLFPSFISLDGPAHLYNASLLNIYESSSFIQSYLNVNNSFLPNYLSHLILQKLLLCFDYFTAEKFLVTLIIVFLPWTFRLLAKTLSKETPYYSFLIFPLVYSSLLHHGFYNFCLGFVFLNLHIYVTLKLILEKKSILYLILLLISSFLLYYCHMFGFAIAVVISFLSIILFTLNDRKQMLQLILKFVIIHIPTCIFYIFFARETTIPFYDYDIEPYEKSTRLMTFSPSIVFEKKEELPYTILLTILVIALIVTHLKNRINNKQKFNHTDLYLMLAGISLFTIFHSKDGDFGGMFVTRLMYLTFYLLIFWIICNGRKSITAIVSFGVVIYVLINLFMYRNKALTNMQQEVIVVHMAREYIPNKSVIQTVVLSEIWFQQHLSNYLGVNKEVILLENYEATLDWFPLMWKDKISKFKKNGQIPEQMLKPDFIFLYGKDEKVKYRLTDSLKSYLRENMVKVFESSDKFCSLYRRK